MLKEIYEQPTAIRETLSSYLVDNTFNFKELNITKKQLQNINQIYIVACGTAMHAGLATKNTIEKLCKVDIASEFRYRDPLIDEHTLCIFISQSGETADTLAALELSNEKGAMTIAVTNVIGSSLTRKAKYSIYTHAGPEIAVASTKAYTSQIVLVTLLTIYFAEILGTASSEELNNLKSELMTIPAKLELTLKTDKQIHEIAKTMYKEKDVFYLGRGVDYCTAQEASLKLKEISYIHSESYAAGELKHGTIALIEKGVNVIGVLTQTDLLKKTVSNIEELITRGAITHVVVSKDNIDKIDKKLFTNIILVPETNIYLSPILAIVLAKSVTVE